MHMLADTLKLDRITESLSFVEAGDIIKYISELFPMYPHWPTKRVSKKYCMFCSSHQVQTGGVFIFVLIIVEITHVSLSTIR